MRSVRNCIHTLCSTLQSLGRPWRTTLPLLSPSLLTILLSEHLTIPSSPRVRFFPHGSIRGSLVVSNHCCCISSGHLQILYGNLSPDGAVAKITGKEGLRFEGVAKVYDSEELMMAGLARKEIQKGKFDRSFRSLSSLAEL